MYIFNDALLKIKSNKRNFFFIILLTILGLSLFIGSISIKKTMNNSLDNYFKSINVMDLKLDTNINYYEADKGLIKSVKGVKDVSMIKSLDAVATIKNENIKVKLNSICVDNGNNICVNKLSLVKGKLPKTINEAIVDEEFYSKNNLSFNTLATLSVDDNSDLRAKKVKIVGIVKKSFDSENNDKPIIYLNENEFSFSNYNNVYVTINDNAKLKSVEKEIKKLYIEEKEKQITEKELNKSDIETRLNDLYESKLPDEQTNEEIKDLTNKLNKVTKELNNAKTSDFKTINKEDLDSFYLYRQNAKKICFVLSFCSLIFLIISILGQILLINKLLDKDKEEINILKKLGYTDEHLRAKYILYIIIANLIGILISLGISKIIPLYIYNIHKTYYGINTKIISTNYLLLLITFAFQFIITISSVIILFYKKYLNINILKIKDNFNKIIISIMILLSSSIIFSGLQLRLQINKIANKEYKKIYKYDIKVNGNNINELDKKNIKSSIQISESKISIKDKTAYLVVASSTKKLKEYINVKNINNKTVTITKNLAKNLKINKNDTIKFKIDNKVIKVKVGNITKNYIDNYIYMSPTLYKKNINDNVNYNYVLVNLKKNNKKIKNELSKIDKVIIKKDEKTLVKKALSPLSKGINLAIIIGIISMLVSFNLLSIMVDKKYCIILDKLGYKNNDIINLKYKSLNIVTIRSILIGILLGNLISIICVLKLSNYIYYFSYNIIISTYILFALIVYLIILGIKFTFKKLLRVNKM